MGKPEDVAVEQVDQGGVGPAELAGGVDDRARIGVQVRAGAAEHGQDLAGGRQVLTGLGEVAPESFDLLAQPPRGLDALDHLASLEDNPTSQDQSTRGTQVVCSRRTPNTTGFGVAWHPTGRPASMPA